jgi:hypothetical protein
MLLIEQQRYPIESVPKYNFSDSVAGGLGLPMGFVELCLSSLKKLHEQPIRSSLGKQTLESYCNETVLKFNLKDAPVEVIPLHAIQGDVSVAAVDVSSMRVGETEEGMLIAVRGAVVWNTRRRYRYLRLGPFIFHITEDNKNCILSLLCKHHFDIPDDERVTPDPFHLPTRIAGVLEKWIQMNLCVASSNSLILFDGSLTAGTPDAPENVAVKLLQTARTRANTVLAFSKSSRLHFNGHLLTDVASKCTPPCLVKINGLWEPYVGSFRLMGDVYVAKLGEDAVSFRLDIDKELKQSHAVDAVQRLLGNDLMYQGYPETLRLAHIYSTFTANEVIGIQRYLAQDCGLKIQVKPNLRRLLFGPFGKGPEG